MKCPRAHSNPTRGYSIGILLMFAMLTASVAMAGQATTDRMSEKGFKALDRGKYEKALGYFEKALQEQPQSAEYLSYVGLARFKLERYEDALEAFDEVTFREVSIVDSALLFYYASSYRALGLTKSERATWKRLAEWDPQSRFATLAIEQLADDKQANPPAFNALLSQGMAHWESRPILAAAYFREALAWENAEKPSEVAAHLAAALNNAERYEEVLNLAQTHYASSAWMPLWNMQLGMANVKLTRWDQAQTVFHEISSLDELGSRARYMEALCLVELGQVEAAQAVLDTLSEQDSESLRAEIKQLREVALGRTAALPTSR